MNVKARFNIKIKSIMFISQKKIEILHVKNLLL